VAPTYTLRQAAEALCRSERFVWNQIQAGRIKAEKSGKALALDAESVIAFARETGIAVRGDAGGRVPPPPPPPLPRPSEEATAEQRARYTFRELGAYEALRRPAIEALRLFSGVAAGPAARVAERGSAALLRGLEELAAGYSAFHGRDKLAHYGRAREAACAAASALAVVGDLTGEAAAPAWAAGPDRMQRAGLRRGCAAETGTTARRPGRLP
jgi:hypothetical protein